LGQDLAFLLLLASFIILVLIDAPGTHRCDPMREFLGFHLTGIQVSGNEVHAAFEEADRLEDNLGRLPRARNRSKLTVVSEIVRVDGFIGEHADRDVHLLFVS